MRIVIPYPITKTPVTKSDKNQVSSRILGENDSNGSFFKCEGLEAVDIELNPRVTITSLW
jgi:hypothetical protein